MKKMWKKSMATWCVAALLMTMPGMYVLADEMQEEDTIVSAAENPEQTIDDTENLDEEDADVEETATEIIDEVDSDEAYSSEHEMYEETIGVGDIEVGSGVSATVNTTTGAVILSSDNTDGGTLYSDWVDKLGINKSKITSIKASAAS